MKIDAPNLNYFWAGLLVEELVRQGVVQFCVAPGSRSSPLALAVASNRRAKSIVHFDERSLGFFALGWARATGKPAAVITTSGTAAANLFPAVIEASRDRVPLLVITADRPPELRDANANQAIDQVKLFGSHVRWFADLPCPDTAIAPSYVLTSAAQAVLAALRSPAGPVHLNCMFREPLAPARDGVNLRAYSKSIARWMQGKQPYTAIHAPTLSSQGFAMTRVVEAIERAKRGVLVVGPFTTNLGKGSLLTLIDKLKWPVLPDVQSGLRFGHSRPQVISYADAVTGVDAFTKRNRPDVILHLGGRPTSKRVATYLAASGARDVITIDEGTERPDAAHRTTLRITADVGYACMVLAVLLKQRRPAPWLKTWTRANAAARGALDASLQELSEPSVARCVSELTPASHGLFLGSSMPIRDMDLAASERSRVEMVAAQRGASGIDGTLSTAIGFATGLDAPVTVILGDLAHLHDLGALALLRESHPVTVVVINNDGGGIFSFLPVAGSPKHFEKFFGTPHGLTFKDAAAMFGLPYVAPERAESFAKAYKAAVAAGRSSIIEVRTSRDGNRTVHVNLLKRISDAVRRL